MLFLLPSDVLVWLLVIAVAVFALYCSRRPHLAAPWARVFRNRAAMAAAVFLCAYLLVGLLDSVHYRPRLPVAAPNAPVVYAVGVRSLLDRLLTPLRTQLEKTYSAPFSTHLFTRENIEQPDGSLLRDYPRLEYAGSHLVEPARDRGADILQRSATAGFQTLPAAGMLLLGLALLLGRKSGQGTRAALRDILESTTLADLRDGQLPPRVSALAEDPEAWVSLGRIRGSGSSSATVPAGRPRPQPKLSSAKS